MEHVVFFPAPDGSPAFRRVATLEDAVRFVEHLRNADGITEVSMHALTEVHLSFRAYYSVEVPGAEPTADAATPVVAAVPLAVVPDAPAAAAPVLEVVPSAAGDGQPSVDEDDAELPQVPAPVLMAVQADAPDIEATEPKQVPAAAPLTSLGFFA